MARGSVGHRFPLVAGIILTLAGLAIEPVYAQSLGGGIANVAPVINNVALSTSDATPVSGTTKAITVYINATDLNGVLDLHSGSAAINVLVQKPGGATHIAAAAATYQSANSATQGYFTYTFNMNFYDAAATGATLYTVHVTAQDASALAAVLAVDATFNYEQLAAVGVGTSSVSFGSTLNPGDTSSIQSVEVRNKGNIQIDSRVSATDLTNGGSTIAVGHVAYSTASDMTGSAVMTTSATTITTFDLAAGAGTGGVGAAKNLYLTLAVPDASEGYLAPGTYTGTLTVAAIAG